MSLVLLVLVGTNFYYWFIFVVLHQELRRGGEIATVTVKLFAISLLLIHFLMLHQELRRGGKIATVTGQIRVSGNIATTSSQERLRLSLVFFFASDKQKASAIEGNP